MKTRIIIMLTLTAAFCILAVLVKTDALSAFEGSVYTILVQYSTPVLTNIMKFFTEFGSIFGIAAAVLLLLLIPSTRKPYGIPAAICAITSAVVMIVLKELIARERPSEIYWLATEGGFSFPSGHALSSTAVYVLILLIVLRKHENLSARLPVLIAAIVIPLLVGTSRIYLGVHYLGDVLGGLVVGVLIALLIDTILQRFKAFT
ncbi:MAG: phosphatase PAP2 family protein [Coriobacteriia bacterium]|nr:phosphatase PAP2 family protein [Coriobacteriia bacterium]MCL2750864.1 phosphatase PAP2 family protein [Coriobacteriia bacterium]